MEDTWLSLNGINSIIGRGVVIHAGMDDLGKVSLQSDHISNGGGAVMYTRGRSGLIFLLYIKWITGFIMRFRKYLVCGTILSCPLYGPWLYSVPYTVHASPLDDQENVSDDGDDNLAANDTDPHLNHATNNSICSCIVLREPSPRNTHKLNHENMTKYFCELHKIFYQLCGGRLCIHL